MTVGTIEEGSEATEAYRTLLGKVGRRLGHIPADLLVRHVLRIVPADEWPVRTEAMDAVMRRAEAFRKDELRVSARPGGGKALGLYATRRKGASSRPYRTAIHGVDPIDGSCDCPDYVRNSLGLCKHLICVLDLIHERPKLLAAAAKERKGEVPGLRWDPIRPLTGVGDWLERVTFVPGEAALRNDERWFEAAARGEARRLRRIQVQPERRLEQTLALANLADPKIEPALVKLLADEAARLESVVAVGLDAAERRAAWRGLKRTLYPYQREGVSRFLASGRLLLADDMGLGKTAQAIAAADILWRAGRARRIVVIAPAALKPQWEREWRQFSNVPVHVVEGGPEERRALFGSTDSGVFIINYEQLIRDLDVVRAWSPDMVVLDEAQRIKNWATKTALSVKGLAPRYRLVLTGTPMENRIEELASVVEWVDDFALEPKWRLGAVHAIRADGKSEVVGVRNLDTARDRLKGCMLRRNRGEVLDQLPPRTDVRVPVQWTEAQRAEHDALVPDIVALMAKAKKRPLTQAEFLRLMSLLTLQRIISNGLAQKQFDDIWPAIRNCRPEESILQGLSAPKLIELRHHLRQIVLEQGRKVVIFSQWRRMLTLAHWAVGDLLAESGLRAGFFTGAEGQRRRTSNIVEFHDDPDFRVLFASDAGGVGLNLQRAANCVVNLELPWNPAVLEQRIGRIYRLGQTLPIDVFNLVNEEGIESRIAAVVGSKQAVFKGLFDGDSDSIRFEQSGSFLSRVEKLVDPDLLKRPAVVDEPADESEPIEIADEVGDELDAAIDAADESLRLPEPEPAPPPPPAPPSVEVARAALEAPRPDAEQRSAVPDAADVARLFGRLSVRREPTGKIVIEAEEETADALGALFMGMAQLLKSVGGVDAKS